MRNVILLSLLKSRYSLIKHFFQQSLAVGHYQLHYQGTIKILFIR